MSKYRPVTPHFTIYTTENSSLYSIWHRLTGIFYVFVLFFILYIFKAVTWGIIIQLIYFHIFLSLYYIYIFILFIFILYYHILNGYRHIIWDTNNLLNNYSIKQSALLLCIILIVFSIINWVQII